MTKWQSPSSKGVGRAVKPESIPNVISAVMLLQWGPGDPSRKAPTQYFWRGAWTLPRGATWYQMTPGITGLEEETLCAKGIGKMHGRARKGWMRPALLPPTPGPYTRSSALTQQRRRRKSNTQSSNRSSFLFLVFPMGSALYRHHLI